jgi:flagellar biosynthesis/type III secretory pathway chaperone
LTPQFSEYAKTYIGRYFIGQTNGLPPPFEERYAFLNSNIFQKNISKKTKRCSMIFSNKHLLEGHQYRNRIVEAILKTNLPVDIWGLGCNLIRACNDSRIKGGFAQNSVLPYEEYDFHICIENIRLNHYFSEKIVNALYSECTPIYLGCKQIDGYFPGQIVHLQGTIDEDIELIRKCLENQEIYKKQINGEQIHEIVNPFFQIETLFMKK